jgi:transmembrane sensor
LETPERLNYLFQKYTSGQVTETELQELLEHFHLREHDDSLRVLIGEQLREEDDSIEPSQSVQDLVGRVDGRIYTAMRNPREQKPAKITRLAWISIAASVLLVSSIGAYFVLNNKKVAQANLQAHYQIKPGGNKAYLTLANGTRIMLTGAKNGALARQSGVQITKSANGQLTYTATGVPTNNSMAEYNTVETPKGGQYQIRLPDGTEVWLNAASSIKYPASFASLRTRTVELTGEAYFEVTKDKIHPFTVRTAKEDVTVLGTHFNVNAYANEPVMKTTLLEGSVKVSTDKDSKFIVPGENAILNNGSLSIAKANVEEAVAWKNGYFRFNGEGLESVMRKLSRWYDIDVQYDNKSDEVFYGKVSRFTKIEDVLSIMEGTKGVHFKIEGRRVIITK